MIDNIIERRIVADGIHSLVLDISVDEYEKNYDKYDNEIAANILNQHLENRGDDGRPSDVKIQHESNSNIVQIFANVNYLGNDHTTYGRH